jgi:hypothetical protein
MQNLTLFISSSDDYEDCWYPFFYLLKRHWPDCDVPIVLNTGQKSFSFPGLDIRCTLTGRQRHFGETFHRGLDHVQTGNLLLLMVDYFLMSPVHSGRLCVAYDAFLAHQLDGLYLVAMTTIQSTAPLSPGISLITGPGQDRFSFQAALWNQASLRKYVLPHETPWMSEQFGSLRYRYAADRLAYLHQGQEPFDYLHTGVLHKGGWIPEAVPLLESLGIAPDWRRRGFYTPRRPSLAERLKKRQKTALQEAKSRLHLLALQQGWPSLASWVTSGQPDHSANPRHTSTQP